MPSPPNSPAGGCSNAQIRNTIPMPAIVGAKSGLEPQMKHISTSNLTCVLLAALSLASTAQVAAADEKLWSTNDTWESGTYTTSYSIRHGGQFPADSEVADDFLVTGTINRVVVEGRDGGTGQPVVEGVYIRFYEWTADGPGALQSEQFVPEGDPDFIHDNPPGRIAVTLPEPFQADGWYFIAAQLVFDDNGGLWDLVQFNRFNPVNEPVWFRDNRLGGVWEYDSFFGNQIIADAGFELWGTPGGSVL